MISSAWLVDSLLLEQVSEFSLIMAKLANQYKIFEDNILMSRSGPNLAAREPETREMLTGLYRGCQLLV